MTPDVVVVGLGAVGSALLYRLARAGVRVTGIDRFHPPHDQGSSHGLTRITRLAVGEGDAFVPLVARSHALWRELEVETGTELYRRTGGLTIASAGADAHAFHGAAGFFARTVAIARANGIAHELLEAGDIRRRYPMFTPDDGASGYLEHDAGLLFPERAVATHLTEAGRRGAVLRLGERVLGIEPRGDAVTVRTDRGELSAARVVVTAGAWMPGLFGAAMGRPLRVLRQVLYWFACDEPALYAPGRCPVWIWIHGPGASGAAYGFPMGDGIEGVKVATEQDTVESDPDRVERHVGDDEVRAMFDTQLRGRLVGLQATAVRTATCLYTNTRDAAFVVRDHAESAAITLVSACSGHGFKHSAALGESLAQRVLGQPMTVPLGAFGPRPAAG